VLVTAAPHLDYFRDFYADTALFGAGNGLTCVIDSCATGRIRDRQHPSAIPTCGGRTGSARIPRRAARSWYESRAVPENHRAIANTFSEPLVATAPMSSKFAMRCGRLDANFGVDKNTSNVNQSGAPLNLKCRPKPLFSADRRLALSARDPLCLHVDYGRLGRRRAVIALMP